MSMMVSVLHQAAVVAEEHRELAELVFPTWVFPLIAAVVFVALGYIFFSFRDVANRHSHKTGGTSHAAHGAADPGTHH